MPFYSIIITVKGIFNLSKERSNDRFMNKSNKYYIRKKIHKRKGQAYKAIILVLSTIVFMEISYLIFSGGYFNDVVNSYGSQANIVVKDYIEVENTGINNPQSSNIDTDWNLTLVNKWNSIPENYAVKLVKVPGGEQVDERIYEPLMQMLEDAKEENLGQLPKIVSGYRTEEMQRKLYNEKIDKYKQQGYSEKEAIEQAEQWVAIPGYSEHQLGFAVDINGATYDFYFWLQENSYKYGFIFRYPGDKTDITGIAEEVWHYRYVGVEAATEMYEQGLCLEEYLDKIEKGQ